MSTLFQVRKDMTGKITRMTRACTSDQNSSLSTFIVAVRCCRSYLLSSSATLLLEIAEATDTSKTGLPPSTAISVGWDL